MKIKLFTITVIVFSLLCASLFATSLSKADFRKIDPALALLIEHPETQPLIAKLSLGKKAPDAQWINVLIKTTLSHEELNQMGIRVFARFADIVSAAVRIENLTEIIPHAGIQYIQLAKVAQAKNDVSVPGIHAPEVWSQYSAKGNGVLIGIVDTGIDWQHEDFRNGDGTTRIKAILDFSNPGDKNGDNLLDGTGPFGGTLFTESQINAALQGGNAIETDDVVGHGTHVAGSAAGNGSATGNGIPAKTYVGVAPEASLIIVKATRDQGSRNFVETDYINAIKFIDSMATVYNMPYVTNLSLGISSGPHDGRDLSEQVIDQITGSGIRGKAIVVSAGNDGGSAIHASGTFPTSSSYTRQEISFYIPPYTANSSNYDDYVIIEGWYEPSYNYRLKIQTPGNNIYGWVSYNNEMGQDTDEGAIYVSNARGGPSNLNGDKQIQIQVYDFNKNKTPQPGDWKIILEGKGGRYDFWVAGSSMKAEFKSQIDNTMIVGTPGTAFTAITVGSYVTKYQWVDLDNHSLYMQGLTLGESSVFSSPGPTRDGRIKPEICAPGELIAASYSHFAPPSSSYSMFKSGQSNYPNAYIARDGKHALSQGTSFAAPHVAGTVALMFQLNPTLDASQIKDAIVAAAFRDQFVQTTPNAQWGYGKLHALHAVQQAQQISSDQNLQLSIFQNPAFTQYIDLFLISKQALASTPSVSVAVANQQPTAIAMAQLQSTLYKGEYVLSGDGIATVTVTATIQGQSSETFYKYFYIKLLKTLTGGAFVADRLKIDVPARALVSDEYLTVMKENAVENHADVDQLTQTYFVNPGEIQFSKPITISFSYDDQILQGKDENHLTIYRLELGELMPLETKIDLRTRVVSATVTRNGAFALFYDKNNVACRIPEKLRLYQNFPNPFNSTTTIRYSLPEAAVVKVKVFDIQGRRVADLLNERQETGFHQILWNGANENKMAVASGVYFIQVSAGKASQTRKVLLIK
ncbi:MAG: S8 family serine peptidase [Calditrichaeota bacterium]|nr:S8 family serine peptidase [Calditrichota bacterium]